MYLLLGEIYIVATDAIEKPIKETNLKIKE